MADPDRAEPTQSEDGDERATEAALALEEIEELEQGSLIEAEPVSTEDDIL